VFFDIVNRSLALPVPKGMSMNYDCIIRLYRTETDYLEWRKSFWNRERIFAFVEATILNRAPEYVRISVDIALPAGLQVQP